MLGALRRAAPTWHGRDAAFISPLSSSHLDQGGIFSTDVWLHLVRGLLGIPRFVLLLPSAFKIPGAFGGWAAQGFGGCLLSHVQPGAVTGAGWHRQGVRSSHGMAQPARGCREALGSVCLAAPSFHCPGGIFLLLYSLDAALLWMEALREKAGESG